MHKKMQEEKDAMQKKMQEEYDELEEEKDKVKK
jgi:hypothetical protein